MIRIYRNNYFLKIEYWQSKSFETSCTLLKKYGEIQVQSSGYKSLNEFLFMDCFPLFFVFTKKSKLFHIGKRMIKKNKRNKVHSSISLNIQLK